MNIGRYGTPIFGQLLARTTYCPNSVVAPARKKIKRWRSVSYAPLWESSRKECGWLHASARCNPKPELDVRGSSILGKLSGLCRHALPLRPGPHDTRARSEGIAWASPDGAEKGGPATEWVDDTQIA